MAPHSLKLKRADFLIYPQSYLKEISASLKNSQLRPHQGRFALLENSNLSRGNQPAVGGSGFAATKRAGVSSGLFRISRPSIAGVTQ